MTDIEVPPKWTSSDVKRWMEKIRREELDFEDQVKIVQFISDQQDAYLDLHAKFVDMHEHWLRMKNRVSEVTKLVSFMTGLGQNDFVDDTTLRKGMRYLSGEALDLYARFEAENAEA